LAAVGGTRFEGLRCRCFIPGIAAGALLAFVNGIGEIVATILLTSTAVSAALHRHFDEFYRGNFGTAAAWGVVQVVLVLLVVILTAGNSALHGAYR
jgi:iron(III) transport system permease protein